MQPVTFCGIIEMESLSYYLLSIANLEHIFQLSSFQSFLKKNKLEDP